MRRPERRTNRPTGELATGSGDRKPGSSEPEFLIVGQIVRPHGLRGEVGMKTITAYPERLSQVEMLFVGANYATYHVERMRRHSEGMIIQFAGVADRGAAEKLRGQMVHVRLEDAVPLADGEHYLFQIEGIRVVTDAGQELGHLTDLIETGANDVYVVTAPDGREALLPVIPSVILNIDLEAHVMTVHLLDGLIQ